MGEVVWTVAVKSVSVIICTHNPRPDYLSRALAALQAQTLPKEQWELLLIDNASKEPLAGRVDLSWHPHARHVRENELGLTAARLRGIQETATDLLVFFDDDNVAAPCYLAAACRIAETHPNLGCYGAGVLEPEFEEPPPAEYQPYIRFLAIRSIPHTVWGNSLSEMPTPWGVGLVVRRVVADQYHKTVSACPIRRGLGRKGQALVSGEDDEFSWSAVDLNLGAGVFVELRITHLIDRRRVTGDYLRTIIFGNGCSCAALAYLHNQPLSNPFKVPHLLDTWRAMLRGHPARAVASLRGWVAFQRRSKTDRAFLRARCEGWEMGLRKLLARNQNDLTLSLNDHAVFQESYSK